MGWDAETERLCQAMVGVSAGAFSRERVALWGAQALDQDKSWDAERNFTNLLKSRMLTSPTVAIVRPVLMDRIDPRLTRLSNQSCCGADMSVTHLKQPFSTPLFVLHALRPLRLLLPLFKDRVSPSSLPLFSPPLAFARKAA